MFIECVGPGFESELKTKHILSQMSLIKLYNKTYLALIESNRKPKPRI